MAKFGMSVALARESGQASVLKRSVWLLRATTSKKIATGRNGLARHLEPSSAEISQNVRNGVGFAHASFVSPRSLAVVCKPARQESNRDHVIHGSVLSWSWRLIEIENRRLLAAIVLAEELDMHLAAQRLRLSVLELKEEIGQLQSTLCLPLFDQDSAYVRLTQQGSVYIEQLRKSCFF